MDIKNGFELRSSGDRGEGVFATKPYKIGEVVMKGRIEEVLEKNHSHASQIGKDTYVLHAGLISKVNHSCEPNCGISVNETGAHDFIAMKHIKPDDEITFDYAMRNYSVDYFPPKCMCGARFCRGRITGWRDLPVAQKKAYEGFIAPYLLQLSR